MTTRRRKLNQQTELAICKMLYKKPDTTLPTTTEVHTTNHLLTYLLNHSMTTKTTSYIETGKPSLKVKPTTVAQRTE